MHMTINVFRLQNIDKYLCLAICYDAGYLYDTAHELISKVNKRELYNHLDTFLLISALLSTTVL